MAFTPPFLLPNQGEKPVSHSPAKPHQINDVTLVDGSRLTVDIVDNKLARAPFDPNKGKGVCEGGGDLE